MKALIFQHTAEEKPGTLLDWTAARGIEAEVHHWYLDPTPPSAKADLLIVLGGPMNVDEEDKHPWLRAEKKFLHAWLHEEKPVLGICLGGQMLSQALGGVVTKAPEREVGFQRITRTGIEHPALRRWPKETKVYQFHGDRFSLPPNCTSLLTSPGCEHQAFALNERTLGLQFHPESTAEWIRGNAKSVKLQPGERFVQAPEATDREIAQELPPLTKNFFAMLDDFVGGFRLN